MVWEAIFLRVSVVMMAAANPSSASEPTCADATSLGTAAVIFSARSGTPMIPVDEGNTWLALAPRFLASSSQTLRAAFRPSLPVAQLALPAFTITARTCPREDLRLSRPTVTGAATTWLRVKTAAADAPSGISARATSGLPLALIPAVAEEKRKPWGLHSGWLTPQSSPAAWRSPDRAARCGRWEWCREPWPLRRSTAGSGNARSLCRFCREVLRAEPRQTPGG